MPNLTRRAALQSLAGAAMFAGMSSASAPAAVFTGVGATGAVPRAKRWRYGAAVRAGQLVDDGDLAAVVLDTCDWVTPEIDMKWNVLQPGPTNWHFAPADQIVRFALANNRSVRGHTLLWEQSTPEWALAALEAGADWSLVEGFMATVLRRYADQVCEWDVVNEPIDTETGDAGFRRTAFQRAFGNGYVARALRTARHHAPAARLMINDYGLEYANPVDRARRRAFGDLAHSLRRDGVPLDGVGMQAHLDLSKGPLDTNGVRALVRRLADLDLTVTITELDVKEADRSASVGRRDSRTADHVSEYLDVVLAEPNVRGLVTWGLSDRDSWLQDGPDASSGSLNRGLPFDGNLVAKPLHWVLQQALGKTGGHLA